MANSDNGKGNPAEANHVAGVDKSSGAPDSRGPELKISRLVYKSIFTDGDPRIAGRPLNRKTGSKAISSANNHGTRRQSR